MIRFFLSYRDSQKTPTEVEEERKILREMLEILEKRDKLVVLLDQLELKEAKENRDIERRMKAAKEKAIKLASSIGASNA